jgi:hypothetical protein
MCDLRIRDIDTVPKIQNIKEYSGLLNYRNSPYLYFYKKVAPEVQKKTCLLFVLNLVAIPVIGTVRD